MGWVRGKADTLPVSHLPEKLASIRGRYPIRSWSDKSIAAVSYRKVTVIDHEEGPSGAGFSVNCW